MRTYAAGPLPMSYFPTPSRCTNPAPGPPTTRNSTSPVGSPGRHPDGSCRLTTAPSRNGDPTTVADGSTAYPST
ncbi:hypothetical protein SVIOM342S_01616 [Streptomyces violaceorubidus]